MGYGDEIIATAEAKEAKKKFSKAKILIGDGKKDTSFFNVFK